MTREPAIKSELLFYLGNFPADAQARVVDFARMLASSSEANRVGVPDNVLMQFAGAISEEDARQMIEAIEVGCEQIDANEW